MLISKIFIALVRCGRYIKVCATKCGRELFSTVKGFYYDRKLGDIDTGYSWQGSFTQGKHRDSNVYEPTGYGSIQRIIKQLKLEANDVFVDFGCGKGRVVFSVAACGVKKVIGVELDEQLAKTAKINLTRLNVGHAPIEILNMDATQFDPKEGTVFFIYNAFGYKTIKEILNNIRKSLAVNPRRVRLVYHNPEFKSILDLEDWLSQEGEIHDSNAIIWYNNLDESG